MRTWNCSLSHLLAVVLVIRERGSTNIRRHVHFCHKHFLINGNADFASHFYSYVLPEPTRLVLISSRLGLSLSGRPSLPLGPCSAFSLSALCNFSLSLSPHTLCTHKKEMRSFHSLSTAEFKFMKLIFNSNFAKSFFCFRRWSRGERERYNNREKKERQIKYSNIR